MVEGQLHTVSGQLAAIVAQTVDAAGVCKNLREFDGLWADMSPRQQVKFVKTLVERVTYDGTTCTVTVGFRTEGIRRLCAGGERP